MLRNGAKVITIPNAKKTLIYLLFLSFYIPVDFPVGNFNINPHDIVFLLIFVLFVAQVLVSKRTVLKLFDKQLMLPLGVLMVYAALQLPFVESPFRVGVEWIQLLQIVFLVLILSGSNFVSLSDKDAPIILKVFFYFSLIGAVSAIVYSLATGRRFVGDWKVWFAFGSLSYGFFYSFYKFLSSNRKTYLFALVVFTAAVVLSRTRGLWISIPLSVGAVLLTQSQFRKKILKYSIAFLAVLVVLFSIIDVPEIITKRFKSIFTGEEGRDARIYRWTASVQVFVDYPFGVGLGNSRYYTPDYISPENPEYERIMSEQKQGSRFTAHNDWFTLLAETGLVGVIFYGWFWWFILRHIFLRRILSPESLITGTFLISIFISTFVVDSLLTGGGLALIFIYYLHKRVLAREVAETEK